MSSYDPDSVREMRPRTWIEQFVTRCTKPDSVVMAEIIAEAQAQADMAKAVRHQLSLRRFGLGHGWFTVGQFDGPRDAYIEAELAEKRAREQQ